MNREEKLRGIVEAICSDMQLFLVEMEIKGNKNNPLIQIYADNEKGITLEQCVQVSRAIQDEIDFDDDFPIKYRLDVSSPGLDRPLVNDFQFRRNIGKKVSLKLAGKDSNKRIENTLKYVDEKILVLEDKNGNEQKFNRDEILDARIKLQW